MASTFVFVNKWDKTYRISMEGHTDPTLCHAISGLYCTFRAMVVADKRTKVLEDDAQEAYTKLCYTSRSRKLKTALEMFITGILLFHHNNPDAVHIFGNCIDDDEFIKQRPGNVS